MKDSRVLSCWDRVLGWEFAFTNEFVPFLHRMCQADKNILCQLCEERRTAAQMRQAPSLSSPPHPLSLRALLLLFSVWARRFKAHFPPPIPRTHITHALPSIQSEIPWLCVCVCVSMYKYFLCTEAALHHHGYIMKVERKSKKDRNKEQQPRSSQCEDSRKQGWRNWGKDKSWPVFFWKHSIATVGLVEGHLASEHVAS